MLARESYTLCARTAGGVVAMLNGILYRDLIRIDGNTMTNSSYCFSLGEGACRLGFGGFGMVWVPEALVPVLFASGAGRLLSIATGLAFATGETSVRRFYCQRTRSAGQRQPPSILSASRSHNMQQTTRHQRRNERVLGSGWGWRWTHAALTRRLFEGGWPWLFTKRMCLGGGRAPPARVAIIRVRCPAYMRLSLRSRERNMNFNWEAATRRETESVSETLIVKSQQ